MQVLETKGPREEVVISDYPLLKKKALELPNPGKEEKAFQQKKEEFLCGGPGEGPAVGGDTAGNAAAVVAKLTGIYGGLGGLSGKPNYDFSSESTSAFQKQFGLLVDAFLNFAKRHQAELDAATQELKKGEFAKDYQFTPDDLKQLTNLKVKMSSVNNVHGLADIQQFEQKEITNYFKKIKQQLEEVLFVMTGRLEQLPHGDTRTATLRSIAATLNTIAQASASGKCTEGTSTLIEAAHAKWCGKKEVGGWLLNFRQRIVNELADGYLLRRKDQGNPVSLAWETHVPTNYRRKACELGIGIPEEALSQDPYPLEREITLTAAETDMKIEFPKRYNYESICEYVARELEKKVLDFLATVGDADTPLQEAQTQELLKLTTFLMDERICRKADIISETSVNGLFGEKVNPYFRPQLLGYCMEYATTLLAAEGFVDDIGQFRYQVLVKQGSDEKSEPVRVSVPLDDILEQKLVEDVDTWQARENGDNLLTDALRCGDFFKFVALLRKGRLPITLQMGVSPASVTSSALVISGAGGRTARSSSVAGSSSVLATGPALEVKEDKDKDKDAKQKPPSERQFDPLARNAKGLTPLAFIIGNPKKVGASSRCLQSWQQRLALQVLLQQPSMTFEEISQAFSAGNTVLRTSFSNNEDCPAEIFSLFFDLLVVKARQSLCLRIGREAAGQDHERLRLIKQGMLPKMELFEVAQLGDEKLKSLELDVVEAKLANMLKDFARKLKIAELLVQHANYKKLHHLLLTIPGLDITGIDSEKASEKNISALLFLLKHINENKPEKACDLFYALASDSKQPFEGMVPICNPLAYKNLLKIVANQCPNIRCRSAFIKAMAAQETDLTLRLILAEVAPERSIVQLSSAQRLRFPLDAEVVTTTPLRLLLQKRVEEAKDKSLQLQRVRTLVECDANPFLPGNESAFAVAISAAITDPTHQEKVIKALLESKYAPDATVLLAKTSEGQSTYKSFTLLWELTKQSMVNICEGQLGLAYAAFWAKEQSIILQQWGAVQLGQIAPAQRSALLESIINNPYQDAKELLATAGNPAECKVMDLERFLEWAQTNKSERRRKFKQQWLAKQWVITPTEVIATKAWENTQVRQQFMMAKAALGSEYDNFTKMIPATCATQLDAQGHSILYYLILHAQMDKLEKLLLDVADLNLESVFSIPGILAESISAEVLTPRQQKVQCLIQMIHILRQPSPNYQYAKQLFLQLATADAGQYQRLVNIVSKQCQQHHQPFFTVLVSGEENINLRWVMRGYIPLDMRLLPFAVKPESSLEAFTQYWDAMTEEADVKEESAEVDVVDSKERKQETKDGVVLPASAPTRTAAQKQIFCTALKTLIDSKGAGGSNQLQRLQLQKLERILSKVNVMDELQASYPVAYQNLLMTGIDALVNLLMATQSKQWPLAVVYYLIYLKKNAAVDDIEVKLEKIINKQCGAKLLAVFNEKVTAEYSTPSQFSLAHRAIVDERYYAEYDFEKASQLLWERKEGSGLEGVSASVLIRDLSLMIQLHDASVAHYAADNRMFMFFRYLIQSCRDELQQQAIILSVVERYQVVGANCFFDFPAHRQAGSTPPQLLPEAELMSRLTAFADQMRALHFPATIIKEFYGELCSLLVPKKCSYEHYPKLIGHFLEVLGCYEKRIFVYTSPGNHSTSQETPLYYLMRTQNFVEVEKILQAKAATFLDVDNGNDSGKTVLMCTMDIKDEKQRNNYVRQLLQRGAKVEVVDREGKNALYMAVVAGYISTALILIEHAGKLFAKSQYQIKNVFHGECSHWNRSERYQHSAWFRASKVDSMQIEVILAMMQYMSITSDDCYQLAWSSSTAFREMLDLVKKTMGFPGYAITRKNFEACLPADYKVAEQTENITRLLNIIIQQVKYPVYYKILFRDLFEQYLRPPRVQDRALLTLLLQGAGDTVSYRERAVEEADVELLELALTKEKADERVIRETPLTMAVRNTPSSRQRLLDSQTQQKMVDLLLEHKADIYKSCICQLALQDHCHFPAFLSLVEHDAKNEFLQPTLLSELKGLTVTSEVARSKFSVLELCSQLQAAAGHFELATSLLQKIIATYNAEVLSRILKVMQKKYPAEFRALLQHYISSNPMLPWELLQLFFNEFQVTMNGVAADPLLHYLIKNPTAENYARIQRLSGTPAFDAKLANGRGLTPLMLLAQHFSDETKAQHTSLVEQMLPTSDMSALCQQKMTALMYAAQQSDVGMQSVFISILTRTLAHDPSNPERVLNQQNKAGHTALRCAAENGPLASVRKLLETKGVDILLADYQGISPIEAAQQAKRDEVVDAFFAVDQDGRITKSLLAQYQQQKTKSSPALKQLVAKILAQRFQRSSIALTELPHQDAEWAQLFIQQLASNFATFFADKAQYPQRVTLLQHLGQCDQALFAEGTPVQYALRRGDAELIPQLLEIKTLRTTEADWQLIRDNKALQPYAIPVLQKLGAATPLPSTSTALILAVQQAIQNNDLLVCQAVWQQAKTLLDAKREWTEASVSDGSFANGIALLNHKDRFGKSALYYAVEGKNYALVVWLLSLPGIDKQAYCATTGLGVGLLAYQQEEQAVLALAPVPGPVAPSIASLFASPAILAAESDWHVAITRADVDVNAAATAFRVCLTALDDQEDAQAILLSQLTYVQQKVTPPQYGALCHEVLSGLNPTTPQRERYSQLYRELYQVAFTHQARASEPAARQSAIDHFKVLVDGLQCRDDVLLPLLVGDPAAQASFYTELCVAMLVPLLNAGRFTVARALLAGVGVQFVSEQELKATLIFRLITKIIAGTQNSSWEQMILKIIELPEWQVSLDQVDLQEKTVLMHVIERGLLSLFKEVLLKTKPTTLMKMDEKSHFAFKYAEAWPTLPFVQPFMERLQNALKQYQVRIQQCQQFANPQQVEQRIAELNAMQTSLQAEEQPLVDELKDMKEDHPDYKAKSTKQSRLLRRVGEIGKEIATLDAIAKDHGMLRVLCEQAKNIAIVLLQYPQYLENSGATADAKLTTATAGATPAQPIPSFVEIADFLLKVWRDPSTTNFTYLKSCYQYLQKFPALAAMNELLFSIMLVLGEDRALPVQWIIQDVTHQSLGAAMQKFIVMFQFLNNDPKDGALCFAVSSMKASAITDASAAGADFCNQILERIGIQALAAQRFTLLKALIAPVKMPAGYTLSPKQQRAADAEPTRNLRLLQQAISSSAPQFSAAVLAAMREDDTVSMLVPSILSASAAAKQSEFKQLLDRIKKCPSIPFLELKQQLVKQQEFVKGLEKYCGQLRDTKPDSVDFARNQARFATTQTQLKNQQQALAELQGKFDAVSPQKSSLGSLFARGRVLAMEFVSERLDGMTPTRSANVVEAKGVIQEDRQKRRDSIAGRKSIAAVGPGFIQGVSAAAVQQDPRYQALQAMKTILEAAVGTAPLDLSSLQPHRGEIDKSDTLKEIDTFLQRWSAWQTAQAALQPAVVVVVAR